MDQSQVINKEASLDTKKLIDLSKQGIEAEADLKDKDIILFVGPTGCGKSTTANYVLGQNMYQKQIKQVKDLDGRICEIEYEVIDSDGSFQIGHTKQSQTISLQIANLRDNYNLCDCPGFFDNRGAEIEIINATSLNKFIQSCASMRMVVLISYYELVAQRGALFMEIFELVTRILKHPEKDQFEKITFLFTKVEEAKQIKVITKEIASFYDCQMGQESYQQQIMKDFLNAILDQIQQSSNNMIVNPLDGNYLEMQQKIINSQPFINPSEEFSFSVSEKSTQKICLYVEETNNTVIKSQQKGHYAKLMETMLEFKQIKDYIQSDYLISSYNDLQREVVKNFEKQKNLVFKIFQEASEKSNIFCTQNMLEIEQIIKQLQIIDTYKERVFEKDIFKTSESEFKQEVQNVCSEIGQRILEFPQNLENVKNHLQKLKDISEQTQIGSQIYKQSLELINHQYQQGFKSFIHLSEQLYQKPNLLDLDKLKNDIDQIASQIEFFKQIDVFIRDFIQENEKQNIYENMKQTQINNNQNILQNLKNLIEYLKQEFKNQPSFEDSLLLFNPEVKMLPDFEINLLRLLNQNIKYSMNIPNCEKNYDEGLQYLKQFNEQLFNFIKENSKDDFHLYKLQTVLKVLESIRNLDSFIQGKTIEEYRQIMEEIRQKIVKKSGEAKEILDKYSDQIEELEEIEILNEEVQKNNKKMEQKEFKKLKDTIDFLISMQWTDEYFQTKFTFHKQTKINKKLTNYFELCIKKIQDLLQDDNYIWIRFFLIKMKHLSIFSIPNFNEKYEECKNSIKIKVKEQNDIINDFIRDMKQEVKYNNFHWKTINEYILYLKKIQKLDMINEVKQNSNLIIANLSNLIEKYYEQNFQQIELFSKGQQAPDTSYSKYHEFIKQAKIISTDYQEIEQLANGYSFDKLTSQVNKIYQSMVFEYIQKKQSIDDLQDIQGNYDAIKRFVDIMNEFDSIKTEFRNLQTPKEVIQDSFKKLDSLIRNEEYQSLDQEIDLLSKLQSERDKLTLSKFLEKLFDTQYSQIQKISIIFQFKRNDQIDFTSLHNDLTKISQILKIFKKYQQQLFHQSEQQLSQFLKDFNENFIKHQNKLLINQVKNLKFKDMESKYDYLKQLISYLGEFKNLFNQAEWDINIKNEIDKIVKEIEQAIFSLHDQRELKHLNSLYYCLSEAYTSNSEQWQRIYSDELQNTKQAIQQLFKSLEQSINDKMQNQDFTFQSQIKQMKEFNQKGENLDSSLYNECLAIVMRIEEQMTEQNNQKYLDILIHFQKGLVKEVITKLKQMKKTDQPAFKKILNTIQQRIDQSVSFIKTSYPVIEVQNLQNELKVILCSMDIIDKFKNENDVCQINDQIIEGLSQHLFTNSNKLFYEFDKIININQESFTAQNLQSFFKHQQFFQILKEQLDETKELKNSEKLFQDILTKLILCLENVEKSQLLDDKLQINSFQIQTWKKFDCLIVLIQSESNIFENSQQLKKIKEIGLKIKTYDTIFKEIKNKFENNEKQFQQFLEECEFQKVKEMIFVLRKSSYLNKELSYEFVDISQLLKQTEQKVTSLTKEAVDIVKSTLNYDQKTNELINKIYRADDHLKGIEQFPYESQMQIVIQTLNDSLDKEIENIHNFSQENSIKIVKVGQVLITIQKIAEHVSKFVQIVDKKLYEAADQIQQILGEEFVFEIGNTYKEDPSMAQIINKIPQFKLYKTEKFNELVGKHDVNYVLSKILQGNKKQQLSTQEKEDLKQYYNIYLSKYEEIIGLYKYKKEKWSEIVESAKLKSKSINLERIQQEKRTVLQMLAQVCAYYTLDESGEQKQGKKNIFKKPNHTQILSVIILLGIDKEYGFWQGVGRYFRNQNQFKNKLIEILTGEGKSLVLGFCSLTLALLGCDVDVICYSNYLSERDNRDFRKLFEIFGVSDKITYGTFKNQAEKFLSNKLNVRKATLDVIKNSKLNKNNKKINEASRFKVMLIDEVDIFFNQSYYGQTYNPVTSLQTPEIEKIIRNIWDLRNQTSDEIVQNIQSSQNYDELIEQYPQFADLFKNHISNLAQDVKKIESHKKQSNYVVKNNKIGYRQNDSTISFTTYKGYQTLFAYFYENSLGNIDDESLQSQICLSLNCGKISYALLPDQYSAILGVTGTLSSLNSQMKKALLKYNFTTQIFTPSMFGDKKLDFKEGDMVKLETDQENQYLQIQEVSAQAIKQQQSVLIFFKDSKSLSEYHESSYIFLPKEDYIVVSEHENSDDVDFEVKRVTRSGQIGLFVREYGRGTDFICLDPKVNNVGGVVVIQTFLSDNKTEEIQIKGRTARQGQQGKYYLILNEKDIQNDFKIEEEQLSQWKNNQKQKSLYSNLDQIRNQLEDETYSSIEQRIQSAFSLHQKSIQFYEDIINQNKQSAIDYINKSS